MKTSVTSVIEQPIFKCLIPERFRRRLSKGYTDSLLGVEYLARSAFFTLGKFPTAAALLNVKFLRLRYLRPGASISRQPPASLSIVISNRFNKEDCNRSIAKEQCVQKSFKFSRMGHRERRISKDFASKSSTSISCSTFSDGKEISEESCNCNKIEPERLSYIKSMLRYHHVSYISH